MSQLLLRALASGKVKPRGPAATAGRAAKAYGEGTANMQDALVKLIGTDDAGTDTLRTKASRMAASPEALMAMRVGLPMAAVAAPAIGMSDDESYANQAMDLLGMGAGMYGMHRGLVGRTTAALPAGLAVAGAGAGALALSDLTQALIGGGQG